MDIVPKHPVRTLAEKRLLSRNRSEHECMQIRHCSPDAEAFPSRAMERLSKVYRFSFSPLSARWIGHP